MVVLALDSSQVIAHVALLEIRQNNNVQVLASAHGVAAASQSESLLPLVDRVLKQAEKRIGDVSAVAAGIGPGSFTGLRIGLATARSLAQALNLKVLGFSSLRALACSYNGDLSSAVVVVDAYQGQVFAGWEQQGQWVEEPITCSELVKRFDASEVQKKTFVGSGALRYLSELQAASIPPEKIDSTTSMTELGMADTVLEVYLKGGFQELETLNPRYMRPSAADLNLAAALQKG